MSSYGGYFKALREAKGLTLREVEKQIDISNAYLSQLESEKIKQPSPITLHKLAQLYEVSYEVLMSKVGYPVTSKATELKKANLISHRLGNLSQEEELELLEYLKFIRNRRK